MSQLNLKWVSKLIVVLFLISNISLFAAKQSRNIINSVKSTEAIPEAKTPNEPVPATNGNATSAATNAPQTPEPNNKVNQGKLIFSPSEWHNSTQFKSQISELFGQISFYPMGQPQASGYKLYGKASSCNSASELSAATSATTSPAAAESSAASSAASSPAKPVVPSFAELKAKAQELITEIEKSRHSNTQNTATQQNQQRYLQLLDGLMGSKEICRVEKKAPYGCLLPPVKFENISTEKTEVSKTGAKVSPLENKLAESSILPGDGTKKILPDQIRGLPFIDMINFLAQPENKESVGGRIYIRNSAALSAADQCCLHSSMVSIKSINPALTNACFEVACKSLKTLRNGGTRLIWWTSEYGKLISSNQSSSDFAPAWRALKKCGLSTLPDFKLRPEPVKKLTIASLLDHAAYNENQLKKVNDWYNRLALMVLKKDSYEKNKPSNTFLLGLVGESDKTLEMRNKVPHKSNLIDYSVDISRGGLTGTEMDLNAKEQKKGANNSASQLVSFGLYDIAKYTFQIPAQPKKTNDYLKTLEQINLQIELAEFPPENQTVVTLLLGNSDSAVGFERQKLSNDKNKRSLENEFAKMKERRNKICVAFQKMLKAKEGLQINIYQAPLEPSENLSTLSSEDTLPAFIERNGVQHFSDLSDCLKPDNKNVKIAFDQDWIEGNDQMAWLHHFLLSP